MTLLQQDEQHVNMLWNHYLKTKNEIYDEAKKDWARDNHIDSKDSRLATELYDEVLMHSTYNRYSLSTPLLPVTRERALELLVLL